MVTIDPKLRAVYYMMLEINAANDIDATMELAAVLWRLAEIKLTRKLIAQELLTNYHD